MEDKSLRVETAANCQFSINQEPLPAFGTFILDGLEEVKITERRVDPHGTMVLRTGAHSR